MTGCHALHDWSPNLLALAYSLILHTHSHPPFSAETKSVAPCSSVTRVEISWRFSHWTMEPLVVTGGGLGIYSVASNVGLYSKGRHLHHGTVKNAVKHWRQQKFYIGYGIYYHNSTIAIGHWTFSTAERISSRLARIFSVDNTNTDYSKTKRIRFFFLWREGLKRALRKYLLSAKNIY